MKKYLGMLSAAVMIGALRVKGPAKSILCQFDSGCAIRIKLYKE